MTDTARAVPKLTSFTLVLCLALLPGCSEDAPEPIDLVINNVTVVDAVNPVRSDQTVLIDQGHCGYHERRLGDQGDGARGG